MPTLDVARIHGQRQRGPAPLRTHSRVIPQKAKKKRENEEAVYHKNPTISISSPGSAMPFCALPSRFARRAALKSEPPNFDPAAIFWRGRTRPASSSSRAHEGEDEERCAGTGGTGGKGPV
jgi:hypothetical protein